MLSESEARDAIIVALDCDQRRALSLAEALEGKARWVKVGMTLFYGEGPAIVSALRDRGGFTGLADARDLSPAGPSPQMEDAEAERIARLRQDLGPMREDIAARIERERQELAATGESQKVVEGYALVGPIGGRSEVMIEVHAVPSPPRVLRWEPWTASTIIEYQVRWLPGGSLDAPDATLSRSARRERLRSASDIENAAGLIATMAGGNVIDEDGFLVGLEEIQEADDQETQD